MFVRSAFPDNLTKFFSFSVFNQASICQSSRNNFWCAEGRWSVKESYEGIRYKTQKCPLKSLYGLLCPSFPQPPSTLGLAYMVTWLIHTKTRLKIINLCTPQSTSTARADRVPYTACDVIIVKHRWNSTCAGRRDFSNHTQMSAIQSNRREKSAKKIMYFGTDDSARKISCFAPPTSTLPSKWFRVLAGFGVSWKRFPT